MGEETYKPGDKLSDAPTFIVDPIDGTTNFFHGFPYVCVSLGFAIKRKPVVGVVYNPFTRQLYTAIKGKGAFLTDPYHDEPVQLPLKTPEPLQDLSHCLVAVEWGSDREGNDYKVKADTFRKLAASKDVGGAMVHSLRSLGSAELNLCAVASGSLDVYWESGCWAWDVCAGWVSGATKVRQPEQAADIDARSLWRKQEGSWLGVTMVTGIPLSTREDTWPSERAMVRKTWRRSSGVVFRAESKSDTMQCRDIGFGCRHRHQSDRSTSVSEQPHTGLTSHLDVRTSVRPC